jgi:uncharacterized membrane protein YukC
MLKGKRLLGIAILICALMFPTSAFASNGNTSQHQNILQSFNQIISNIFGNNKKSDDSLNYFEQEKEKEKKEKEKRDKEEKEKKDKEEKEKKDKEEKEKSYQFWKNWCNPEPEESFHIWENWFCY